MRLRSLRGSAAISKRRAANLGIDSSTIRKNRVLRALDLGFWAWQPAKLVLIKDVGRAGPVWRHAFVRFTENRVIRTFFLSGIRLEHEREGTWSQIFSAASCPRLQAPAAGLIQSACIDG